EGPGIALERVVIFFEQRPVLLLRRGRLLLLAIGLYCRQQAEHQKQQCAGDSAHGNVLGVTKRLTARRPDQSCNTPNIPPQTILLAFADKRRRPSASFSEPAVPSPASLSRCNHCAPHDKSTESDSRQGTSIAASSRPVSGCPWEVD